MEGQITICGGGNQAHASVARIGQMNPKQQQEKQHEDKHTEDTQ
jgi:hypothetical protein